MALYHKVDVKNGFAYELQFFSLISDGLGGVSGTRPQILHIRMSDVSHLSPFFISAIFLRETKHETAYNENAIVIK